MPDILSAAELILSDPDKLSSVLIVSSLITAFVVGIAEYGKKLWAYITNRRNKWWVILFLVFFAAVLFLQKRGFLSGYPLIAVSVLLLLYGVVVVLSFRPKTMRNYSNLILRLYEKRLSSGRGGEYADFFRKKHWYFLTLEDRLEFLLLSSQYFENVLQYEEAYRSLDGIKDCWLYESEKELVKLQRALLLTKMGSMNAALVLFGPAQSSTSDNPLVWIAYSLIAESAGDIDGAAECAERAAGIVESGKNTSDLVKAEVYNECFRIAVFRGNNLEALRYLDEAWSLAKKDRDMRSLHIIASNRINRMALAGKTREECEAALKEYESLIPNDSFLNRIEFNNCRISFYRQIGDSKREYELLKSGFLDIIDHLDVKEKATFTASTFRMVMNAHFEHSWFDSYVEDTLSMYRELPVLNRNFIYKEYMGILDNEEFLSLSDRAPYSELKKQILEYYSGTAVSDIDRIISEVPVWNKFKYMNMMTMKLFVLKIIEGRDHIDKSRGIYLNLYNELSEAGLELDAVNVLVTLVDECTSKYNVMLFDPLEWRWMNYSDLLSASLPAPEPALGSDGIHLLYPMLQVPGWFTAKPLHKDVIEEHIDTIIEQFRSWKNHPFKIGLSIEIAHLLLGLDRKDEAREFYQYFLDSGVSPNQMASWVRADIEKLKEVFSGDDA